MTMMIRKRNPPSQEEEFSTRMTTMTMTRLSSNLQHDNPLLFHPPRITAQTTTMTTNLHMMSTRATNSAPAISSPISAKPVLKPSPPNAPPKLVMKKKKTPRNQPPQSNPSHPSDQSVDRQRRMDGKRRRERRVRRLWMKCNGKRNGWPGIWGYDRKSRLQRKLK